MCTCEFDERYAEDQEESFYYHRVCPGCGLGYAALHCPHDGIQIPCPKCGLRTQLEDPENA